MVVALKPIHDAARSSAWWSSTYQSVSGAGKEAMDELLEPDQELLRQPGPRAQEVHQAIAFNVIPHIDVFLDDGSTKEEWKMVVETKKILDAKIKVHATCVRVPVFVGHAEAIYLELEQPLDEHEARAAAAPRRRACWSSTAARTAATSPPRNHRRGRGLREPLREDPTVDERPVAVGGQRQPAQGRRPQRRADRRGADQRLHLRLSYRNSVR